MKSFGKPYEVKLCVRFDEGMKEIENDIHLLRHVRENPDTGSMVESKTFVSFSTLLI